ncbi:phosphonates import ATP-binding protein PhnC [Paenibacillus montaniterrae]|uniref:Phosphonates import ATP-binding protein PhnC n=1 Tax=Paenibacillus montaniterrae TaxID=429341 RepID=A0A920D0R4_9BACL|nr:phosphonate ABC transporter ATP-binding protein [Paenibacillus montaniterrae]GIP18833.1 phosphonates import ATP-binding protein PhnC [Paenibacillus montaniterrae]
MTLLQVEQLKKVYPDGTVGLKGISFELEAGEFVAVIGPSGAGKSTLLRCLNRMVESSSGTITLQGNTITKVKAKQLRAVRRKMGMIFQGYNLVARSTVLTNVLHGRLGYMNSLKGALGLFNKQDTELAKALLNKVGLSEQMYKRADELSGGQQQRVGIARALAQRPALILADEPIASLDPAASQTVMQTLYEACKADGIACLCNLHQVEVAKKFATRIIGIRAGEKVFDGAPEQLTDEMISYIYEGAKHEEAVGRKETA